MNYIVDHIPRTTLGNKRSGRKLVAKYITIHNTANPTSTAQNERDWLTNPANTGTGSWHISIDEKEAIEAIPLDEIAWHAGDGNGQGNTASIGIEICESGNYAKTVENAIELVAQMLHERGWGVDRLRRHFDWSGKICPRKMYVNGHWKAWEAFKERIQNRLEEMSMSTKEIKEPDIGPVTILANGHKLKGMSIGGVSMVPVSSIAQALGRQVEWNADTKTVTVKGPS